MADVEMAMPSPSSMSKKRSHDGEVISLQAPQQQSHELSPAVSRPRSASVASSSAASSLTELTSITIANPSTVDPNAPEAKKRKLTFAEREVEKAVRKQEQEEKARAKEAEKAQKEEEKRVKDEEKRKKAEEKDAVRREREVEKAKKEEERKAKEAERAEKKAAKDAEKEEKEAEKARQEAEKLKKERAQMRLGSFFNRPTAASTPPSTPDDVSSGVSTRRSSIASIDIERPILESTSKTPVKSGYSAWILPFFPHEHTELAPANRFLSQQSARMTDEYYFQQSPPSPDVQLFKTKFASSRRRTKKIVPIKSLIPRINGSAAVPVNLTNDEGSKDLEDLARTSFKFLQFREDVRPPYQGTYTRAVSPRSSRKLARKPSHRGLPDTNYDDDSEAEWQEPEPDDEELDDDDERSEDEDDVDGVNDFLDDEFDTSKPKFTAADVEPVSSGLCWEGDNDEVTFGGLDLSVYRMDVLHDATRFPIDPYSDQHWVQPPKAVLAKPNIPNNPAFLSPAMQPPRAPLSAMNAPNTSPIRSFMTGAKNEDDRAQSENANATTKGRGRMTNPNKPLKMIPADVLPAFKLAIEGSDLNKVALTEILKKKFPKCSKDAIKDTLSVIAMRQGVKEADKKWVLIE